MHLGYNTNGLAHNCLVDAIRLLADIGYRSVAITIDHGALNPFTADAKQQLAEVRSLLNELELRSVVETGARYLLDPRCKHHPTLLSPKSAGRPRRVEFLRHAIDIAAELGSDCVSLWSGVLPAQDTSAAGMRRLVEGLRSVLEYARRRQVRLGFEPEPGMLINTMASFAELLDRLDAPDLGLTLDVGHLHCLGEVPIAAVIHEWADRLVNVHVEDMRSGVHEHLMFGEGEIDFPPVIAALCEVGYDGGVHVELSRHSHEGPAAAEQAFAFLRPLLE